MAKNVKKWTNIFLILIFACGLSSCSSSSRGPSSGDCQNPGESLWWVPNIGKDCKIWYMPPQ